MKTGHCPWSGKEVEAQHNPEVRKYLDSLPGRTKPTKGEPGWLTPQIRSRRAVDKKMNEGV